MRLLSSFQPMKLYRNKQILLDSADQKKNPKLYAKLVLISPDRDEIVTFFNPKRWIFRYIKSIFTEKILRFKLVTGLVCNIRQRPIEIYKWFKSKMKFIRFTFLYVKQYGNKNIIYDASNRLSAFTEHKFPSIGQRLKQAYKLIDDIHNDNRFSSYKKKYYFIYITDEKKIDVKYFNRFNLNSIQQIMLYRIYRDHQSMSDYIGSTFVIMNTTGLFTYFNVDEKFVEKGLPPKFFLFLKTMWAYAANDDPTAATVIAANSDVIEQDEDTEETIPESEKKLEAIASKITTNPIVKETIKDSIVNPKSDEPLFKPEEDDEIIDDNESEGKDLASTLTQFNSIVNKKSSFTSLSTTKRSKFTDDETEQELDEYEDDDSYDDSSYSDETEDETKETDPDDTADAVDNAIENDEDSEDAKEVINSSSKPTRTPAQQRKFEKLKEEFMNVTLDDKSFSDMLKDFESVQIETRDIPVKTNEESIKHATAQDMTRTYYEKKMDPTIISIMKMFAENPEIKMVVTSATKEDISDQLNALYRYTFKLTDEFGKHHTLAYDIPKLVDNKFFIINGTKKILSNQIITCPVTKIDENEVHFYTAYNQMILSRFGTSLDPKFMLLKKLLALFKGNGSYGIAFNHGNNSYANAEYNTSLEYYELGKLYYSIKIVNKSKSEFVYFIFNQIDIKNIIADMGIAYVDKPNMFPVGITHDKKIIYISTLTGKDIEEDKYTIIDLVLNAIQKYAYNIDINKCMNKFTVLKRYIYTRLKFIDRNVSIGSFLGYLYGLETLLKESGVKYEFVPDRKRYADLMEKYSQAVIRFKDGYLYYDVHPLRNSLILNGIADEIDTELYTFEEMNTTAPYSDSFYKRFRTNQMEKGYNDAKIWMMDPISEQVMKEMGLPHDFLHVMLYANSLLEDNAKIDPKNLEFNRIRKMELIPVYMYKSLTSTYNAYRNKYGNSRTHMTVKPNDIINKLSSSRLLNDYDTLNPIRELEIENTTTYKGPGGCNVDDAYKLNRRAYDKSMMGVLAASSPDSGSVGITRYLSFNPRIVNTMGMVKSGDDESSSDIGFGNIGSVAELTTPFAIDHDDPRRLAFVTKESKHLMPANDTDPLLIGNGVEKVLPYVLSNDFISIAKEDGVVESIDENLGLAIVKYKSGKTEAIDIANRQQKNGGMGFYILNKKEFMFKVGDKFKANDVLCKNPSYFSTVNGKAAPEYQPGVLSNVAIIMSHTTHEDSCMITENISDRLGADVVYVKQIVLDAKATLYEHVNIGDTIETGDPLMIFEDAIDDPEISAVIANADTSNMKALDDIVKNTPRAKISGIVQDIKIYYTVEPEEMSDSMKKFVNNYIKRIKDRRKYIENHSATNPYEITLDHLGVTKPQGIDKINGAVCPIGKVLVEIYERYTDYPGSGDKIVFYASMKTTIHRQIPKEMAPYPIKRPEQPIDAILSPIAIEARMVTSILYALYGNKLVCGLKERIRELYDAYSKGERLTSKREGTDYTTEYEWSLGRTLEYFELTTDEINEQLALENEGIYNPEKTKNIYVVLYAPTESSNPINKKLTEGVRYFTESEISHSAWSIDKSGYFLGCDRRGADPFGAVYIENLNTNYGIRDQKTKYIMYKIPVSDAEYERAVKLYNQDWSKYKYDMLGLVRIMFKIIGAGSGKKLIEGFDENDLNSKALVCSAFVAMCLCKISPDILKWFKNNNVSIKNIAPSLLKKIPSMQYMFTGNAKTEIKRWFESYERTYGELPN